MWSPLEYECHVRDVFRLFDERLTLMMSADDPHFANWDQDATAIADDYASQDAQIVAAQLVEAAAVLAERFDAVTADDWGRRGFRSDDSAFTVDSLGRYLMHDPVHHLWDVGAEVPTYITRALMSWMLYLSRHYAIRLAKDLVGNSLERVINLNTSSQ